MPIASYDAKQVSVLIGSQPIYGAADEDFCSVEYDEDHVALTIGAGGEAARSMIRNYAATITLTLMATSLSNNYLSDMYAADRLNGGGVFAVLIKDPNGKDLFTATNAWVKKPPAAAYGREVGTREWVIQTSELISYHGGYELPAS